jgi:cytochrome c-type biogenesis protein CcmH/NrfG
LDPLLVAAYVGLGGSRAEMGELEGAEEALERAARLRPDSPQLLAARRRLAELRAGER